MRGADAVRRTGTTPALVRTVGIRWIRPTVGHVAETAGAVGIPAASAGVVSTADARGHTVIGLLRHTASGRAKALVGARTARAFATDGAIRARVDAAVARLAAEAGGVARDGRLEAHRAGGQRIHENVHARSGDVIGVG